EHAAPASPVDDVQVPLHDPLQPAPLPLMHVLMHAPGLHTPPLKDGPAHWNGQPPYALELHHPTQTPLQLPSELLGRPASGPIPPSGTPPLMVFPSQVPVHVPSHSPVKREDEFAGLPHPFAQNPLAVCAPHTPLHSPVHALGAVPPSAARFAQVPWHLPRQDVPASSE